MNYELREHQKDFVRFFKKSKTLGILAWHDMGLGKTLSSLHIGMHYTRILRERGQVAKLAIVCPKSIVTVWEEHIRDFFKGDFGRVSIIPYSQLKKYSVTGKKLPYKFLILDECHYLRNKDTQRLGHFLGFLGNLGSFHQGRIIALSGTPMINSGLDLFVPYTLCSAKNLEEALVNLHMKQPYYKWRATFTKKNITHFGIKYEGIQNEKKLFDLLAKMTHRKKLENCIDMPPMTTMPIDLKIKDDRLLLDVDINNPDAYISVLEALSRAKTPKLIEYVKENYIETGLQTIVFSVYKEALKMLQERFPKKVALITGEQSSKERERVLKAFKEGKIQVLGLSYACGAEGLNLQHCQHAVYHSYPWTSALMDQAQARIHRPGQKKKTFHYVLTSGECDRHIFYTVMRKRHSINKLETMMAKGV